MPKVIILPLDFFTAPKLEMGSQEQMIEIFKPLGISELEIIRHRTYLQKIFASFQLGRSNTEEFINGLQEKFPLITSEALIETFKARNHLSFMFNQAYEQAQTLKARNPDIKIYWIGEKKTPLDLAYIEQQLKQNKNKNDETPCFLPEEQYFSFQKGKDGKDLLASLIEELYKNHPDIKPSDILLFHRPPARQPGLQRLGKYEQLIISALKKIKLHTTIMSWLKPREMRAHVQTQQYHKWIQDTMPAKATPVALPLGDSDPNVLRIASGLDWCTITKEEKRSPTKKGNSQITFSFKAGVVCVKRDDLLSKNSSQEETFAALIDYLRSNSFMDEEEPVIQESFLDDFPDSPSGSPQSTPQKRLTESRKGSPTSSPHKKTGTSKQKSPPSSPKKGSENVSQQKLSTGSRQKSSELGDTGCDKTDKVEKKAGNEIPGCRSNEEVIRRRKAKY